MKKIKYEKLLAFTKKILLSSNLDHYSANSVSLGLCETSLRGVESHGIRLLKHYVESALNGRKNPKPKFIFKKKFDSFGILDADNGFGHSAGMKAINYGIKLAKKNGIAAVTVINSSHPGSLATMALKGAREGYITFAFTHADSLMLSHNGIKPYFGTNPICMAAPRIEKEPYCLDMSTAMISWNKLLEYRKNNKKLMPNLAANNKGKTTIDPQEATQLFPAGSYKGFGLASMVEILCGVHSGMPFAQMIPSMFKFPMNKVRKLGQFYILMRTDITMSKKQFLQRMQKITNEVRSQKSRNNKGVLMPNDPEIFNLKKRIKEGIPLNKQVFDDLKYLSNKFNIKLDLLN